MLSGIEAFAAIDRILRGGRELDTPLADPPYERLRLAIKNDDASLSDLAVLMRHALRYGSLAHGRPLSFETNVLSDADLRNACLLIQKNSGKCIVTADPWVPEWLVDSKIVPTDEGAMRAERKRFDKNSSVDGDPFLSQFGLSGYRSKGQRSAVRAALGLQPGSNLIIDLPTGEGKSLVFRAVSKIGFANDRQTADNALTIVIVPTVTLALDHERSCGGSADKPLAYIGGERVRNTQILDAMRSGDQELLFAAPEAVVGPLRRAISKLAENDGIRAVFIDEAHLVEGWGTGFRTEFQTFAGVCHQWRNAGDSERSFRLVFLSATFSEMAKATLEELFSPDEDIPVVSAASIRPEPEYWVSENCDEELRKERILDALMHLPRPAILYVTKVEDAEFWYRYLRDEIGFKRLKMVHGGTRATEREKVLGAWSDGRLDLVVATSAFGLGIDYPHVRTVIHACLPETLDRFYQEVGRAGRDGCASISLLVPTYSDERVASGLSQKKIITVKRGLERWKAMFQSPDRLDFDDNTCCVRLDVAPSFAPEDIDLIGERSIDWNGRVLSMMARSGFVRLTGVPDNSAGPDVEERRYQCVQICDDGHMSPEVWGQKFSAKRDEIADAGVKSFELLKRLKRGNDCPGELIVKLYQNCAHTCSSCRKCRTNSSFRRPSEIIGDTPLQSYPYAPPIGEALDGEFGLAKRLVVEYESELPTGIRSRDVERVFLRLDQSGFRILVCVGDLPAWIAAPAHKILASRPWLTVNDREWQRPTWPSGNSIIFSGKNVPLSASQLNSRASKYPEIVFIPKGVREAQIPERRVADMLILRSMGIGQFFERFLR